MALKGKIERLERMLGNVDTRTDEERAQAKIEAAIAAGYTDAYLVQRWLAGDRSPHIIRVASQICVTAYYPEDEDL
ncbi:MAG: hypothetical protein JSS20_10790 [Proteobacteria bacterium]|nr:hypothetical protein [Pseudomonadota bacterium]